ncbi:kinase-like domain-containing protein [Mycotypha africana]|uniref:kinase-like domain-containing protein n=1 Tax=Mycotypha africana TaxID=64632 RepID=UPI002301C782|nr:kinase-like domain-containing protein [Mycotypha africana]KAI8984704.1 kinase-like domain-containing protein [Mycotypha africana]
MALAPAQIKPVQYTTEEDHIKHYNCRASDPSMSKPHKTVGKYYLSKTLGKGSMGKVKLATNIDTQEKVAVKIVPRRFHSNSADPKKTKDVDKSREIRTIREASIMLLLDHPNIAKVYEMSLVDNYYYLFMEYVDGGQLLDYVISHGKLKEKHARDISRQIASALDYCHRNLIVHRDLKVENILLSTIGTIKIIDFGLSNVFSPKSQLNTFCGSLYFAAPELLDGRVYTGPEVDIWSFGIIIYVLVCGQVPFDDPTMGGMHAKVKKGHVNYPAHLSSDCRNMLQRMIVTEPKNRATLQEVLYHPWMNRGYDSIVDNHLPKRKPLQLPVDMNVIRGMKGFDFGTEESIKKELEALITSEEYQQSTKEMDTKRVEAGGTNVLHSVRRKSLPYVLGFPSQQIPPAPQTSPPAFHPLISVYYLVQEHMQKEDKQTHRLSATSATDTPTVGISYTAEGKRDVYQSTVQEEQVIPQQMSAQLSSNGRAALDFTKEEETVLRIPKLEITPTTTSASSASSNASSKPTTKQPNLFRRLSRRIGNEGGKQPHTGTAVIAAENNMLPSPPPPSIINIHPYDQRHNMASAQEEQIKVSASADNAQPVVTINLPEEPSSLTSTNKTGQLNGTHNSKWNRLLKRATSMSAKKDYRRRFSHLPQFDAQIRRKSTCGSATLENKQNHTAGAAVNATTVVTPLHPENMYLTLPPSSATPPTASTSADTVVIQQHERTEANNNDCNQMTMDQADDLSVKSVYIRGLFSVSTTSNKKPAEIRKEIVRVLQANAYIEFKETKDRFKCVLLSKPNRIRNDPTMTIVYFTDEEETTSCLVEQQRQQQTSAAKSKRYIFDYSIDDPQAVRFDIYIVKIPWLLGMRGIRFRRIMGDPWHYKNICSKILDSIKL